MNREGSARRSMINYLKRLDAKGWVANHDGNVSVKLSNDRFLCTPTAMSKADITEQDLLVVQLDGTLVRGRKRLFSEWVLHRTVYANRPEVESVFHSHSPYATAFGASQTPLPHPFLPELSCRLDPKFHRFV